MNSDAHEALFAIATTGGDQNGHPHARDDWIRAADSAWINLKHLTFCKEKAHTIDVHVCVLSHFSRV